MYWAPTRSQEVTLYWGSVCEWDSGPAPEVVIRGKEQQSRWPPAKQCIQKHTHDHRRRGWEEGFSGNNRNCVWRTSQRLRCLRVSELRRFHKTEMRMWWLREETLPSAWAELGSTCSSGWWRPGRVVRPWARPEGTQEDERGLGLRVHTPGVQSNQECGIPLVQKGAWGAGRKVWRDEELEMQEADGIAGKATSFSGGQTGAENTGGQMRQVMRHLSLRTMTGRWGWTHVRWVCGGKLKVLPWNSDPWIYRIKDITQEAPRPAPWQVTAPPTWYPGHCAWSREVTSSRIRFCLVGMFTLFSETIFWKQHDCFTKRF